MTDCGSITSHLQTYIALGTDTHNVADVCPSTLRDEVCSTKCAAGYTPVANLDASLQPGVFLCTSVGWQGNYYQCIEQTCKPLLPLRNGGLACNGSVYQSVCQVQCDKGYTLSGTGWYQCNTSSLWSYTDAVYVPPKCSDTNGCAGFPCNGSVSSCVDRTAPSSPAQYNASLNDGYDCVCHKGLKGSPGPDGNGCVAPSIGYENGHIILTVGADLDISFTQGNATQSVGGVGANLERLAQHAQNAAAGLQAYLNSSAAAVYRTVVNETARRVVAEANILATRSTTVLRVVNYQISADNVQASGRTSLTSRILQALTAQSGTSSSSLQNTANTIVTGSTNINATLQQQLSTQQSGVQNVAKDAAATTDIIVAATSTIDAALSNVAFARDAVDAAYNATNQTLVISAYAIGNVSIAQSIGAEATSNAAKFAALASTSVTLAQGAITNVTSSLNSVLVIIRTLNDSYVTANSSYSLSNASYTQGLAAVSQAVFDIAAVMDADSQVNQSSTLVFQANSASTRCNTAANQAYNTASSGWDQGNAAATQATNAQNAYNTPRSLAQFRNDWMTNTIQARIATVQNSANQVAVKMDSCGDTSVWMTLSTGSDNSTLSARRCMSQTMFQNTPSNAFIACRALGARICKLGDFQAMCGATAPYTVASGFYGDHGNLVATYKAWNSAQCDTPQTNIQGQVAAATVSYYRCCK